MTIASQTSRISYTGDGVTTAFSVPFYFAANADLIVYLQDNLGNSTLQVLGTHYSLTGATLSAGGTCTFVTAPTATTGAVVTIYRDPPITQITSYNNNDPFPAKSHELALDKLTTIDQRNRDLLGRTIRITDSESASTVTALAPVGTRKNKLLGFGTNGEMIYPLGPSFVGSTSTGVAIVDSRATAQVTTFAISVNVVRTEGLATPGDGGGAEYIRGIVGDPGAFQDAGGVYWKFASVHGGVVIVDSRVTAAAGRYAANVNIIRTEGLATPGDGGGAEYVRGIISSPGAFLDASGTQYWGLAQSNILAGPGINITGTNPITIKAVDGVLTTNVLLNGLVADLIVVDDGVCNATTTFTSATANFTPAAVGKSISIVGRGAAGNQLITTIAAYVNSTTVTLALAASSSGSGNVSGYGTDNTAALNTLIAATTNGGTIFFPRGNYGFAGKVNISQVDSITFIGVGGPLVPSPIVQAGPATLTYIGAGTGHFIDIQSTQYITLRNLMLDSFATSWTGFMVAVRNNGHGDPAHTLFDSVYFGIAGNANGLLLDTSIETNILNTSFTGGLVGIQGITSALISSYANIVHMAGGQFAAQGVSPVFQAGSIWAFDHVTFEPLRNGQAVVYTGTAGIPSQLLSFTNCYIADASVPNAVTFTVYGNGFTLINNLISGGGGTDIAVLLHANKGINITGNCFQFYNHGIDYASATVQGGIISGNTYHSVTTWEASTGNKDATVISTGNISV